MESDSGDGLIDGLRRRLQRDTGWYCLPSGAYLSQGISWLVVGSWYVEELASFKIPTDLLNKEAIACHICVLGIPIAG